MTFTDCINMGGTMNECNAITEPTVSTAVAVAIATLLLIANTIAIIALYKEVKK